jgi:spoIIIJ-associated protein
VDWGTAPPTASRPSKLPERPGGDLTPTEPVQASRDIVDEEEETAMAEMSLQQQGDAARSFVVGVVERLGIAAQVELRPVDEETITVAVDGEQVGPLVGHGGAALAALQELTRTYVQKLTGGQSDRIMVDVAGYRERRVAALQRFARKIAEEVLETGEPRALEPMAAADRKVVHDTVNEIEGVTTRSEGDEPRRYIVIVPAGPATDA